MAISYSTQQVRAVDKGVVDFLHGNAKFAEESKRWLARHTATALSLLSNHVDEAVRIGTASANWLLDSVCVFIERFLSLLV